jgi:hypothetical protein
MDTAVVIERGFYVIDTHTWTDQRTGRRDDTLTESLREFISQNVFSECQPSMDTGARMQLWCTARGLVIAEGGQIYHDHGCLNDPVTIVLAADPQPDGGAYALVQVDDDQPIVYHDLTTDIGYWYRIRAVDIVCPDGHRWTWREDSGLLDEHGHDTTLAAVFGPDRDAPYRRCRDCAAFDNGDTDTMCDCGDTSAIYCPTCDQPCRLTLTDVPTHSQPGEVHP